MYKSLVSIYTPTLDSEDEDKGQFYTLLDELAGKLLCFDLIIILGGGGGNVKVEREKICKAEISDDNLHINMYNNKYRMSPKG